MHLNAIGAVCVAPGTAYGGPSPSRPLDSLPPDLPSKTLPA
jgi:hypothetical protein